MARANLVFVLLLCSACIMTACQRDTSQAVEHSETTRSFGNGDSGNSPLHQASARAEIGIDSLNIPPEFIFKKAQYPVYQHSWEDLIAILPEKDSSYLKRLNEEYFGALEYENLSELQAMVRAGFPAPDEWLAAYSMTDAELERLADAGNQKARAFYLDRLLTQAAPYLDLRGKDDAAFSRGEGAKLAMKIAERTMAIQSSYPGPFAGYVLGRTYSTLNYPSSPEAAVAGMFLAAERGDARAIRNLQRYEGQFGHIRLSTVLAAYSSFR